MKRRFHFQAFLDRIAEEERKRPLDQSMRWWVETHGPLAAGWLVFNHRRQIHRYGAVDFKIQDRVKLPPWFRVAIETLKRRHNERWTVVTMGAGGMRTFRVQWHQWGEFAKTSSVISARELS